MQRRRAGILLHPTSLPGPDGVGTLGVYARRFIDRLAASGFSLWQILPLGPPGCGNSPYAATSAFAGNSLLVDLSALVEEGDLAPDETCPLPVSNRVDFPSMTEYKQQRLRLAARRFLEREPDSRTREFWAFCDTTFWLHDHALYVALKKHFRGAPWYRWPEKLRCRDRGELDRWSVRLGPEIGIEKYLQWQFRRQWRGVREHAIRRGVKIVGDTPIFVSHDSSDVWCNQHLFMLDVRGRRTVVAGVPPDYFSSTGQLWGNPLYRWERHIDDGFSWWLARIKSDLELYDMVRIDHFRGFSACWGVPASHRTARQGEWIPSPGYRFFEAVKGEIGHLPFIAEDLGIITPDVEALREHFGLPGMKILQFAFDGGPANPYLPHNHRPESVVYTGTHDNDTLAGWVETLSGEQRKWIGAYLGIPGSDDPFEGIIRALFASTARFAILPLQDLLRLDSSARMNVPGTATGNWGWRAPENCFDAREWDDVSQLIEMYGRYQG